MSEVTSLEWIDQENFLVAETSGMITLDRVNSSYFRKVIRITNHSALDNGFSQKGLYVHDICFKKLVSSRKQKYLRYCVSDGIRTPIF